jgi:CubicO group peptidase (beta-lactamase class C family)
MKTRLFFAALAIGTLIFPAGRGAAQDFPYQVFERYVEPLAQQIGMPGLSAVIVRNNRVEWHRGYGFSDVENRTTTEVGTLYPVGGVTQAVTAALIGICADRFGQFGFDIERPIRLYAPAFPHNVSIRHVLAHASESRFRYDPAAYAALTAVVQHEDCMGMPYRVAAATEIFDRTVEVLGRVGPMMPSAVPGLDLARSDGPPALLFESRVVSVYQSLLRSVAVPYRIDRNGRHTRSEYSSAGFDAASGLVASAYDLASFETALDRGIPLSRSTLNQMWSNALVVDGNSARIATPTGLGWFVQNAGGEPLVWTFGHIPDASSALILKMPRKNLTLIMLSNSDGLANGYNFEQGDVTTSPFVKVFLRLFI